MSEQMMYVWTVIIAIFGVCVMVYLTLAFRAAMPKSITKYEASYRSLSIGIAPGETVQSIYNRRERVLFIKSPRAVPYSERCDVKLQLRPMDNIYVPKSRRRLEVVGIESTGDIVRINSYEYKMVDGKWSIADYPNVAEKNARSNPVLLSHPSIDVVKDKSRLICELEIKY